MLQHDRREGGVESSAQGGKHDGDERPRTKTRTEEIDQEAGIEDGTEEPERPPDYREARIEFLERHHAEDGVPAEPRRQELRREGCQALAAQWDVPWPQEPGA